MESPELMSGFMHINENELRDINPKNIYIPSRFCMSTFPNSKKALQIPI